MREAEKSAKDYARIKQIAEHYEVDGEQIVYRKTRRYRRLYKLAYGVLDPEDYIDFGDEKDFLSVRGIEIEDTGLMFYPIIPNIVEAIKGEARKRFTEFHVHAVNPENTSDILDRLTADLRTNLIQAAEQRFLQQEPTQEEHTKFMQSEKIMNYYQTEYRTTIEQWANHQMNIDKMRLDMENVENRLVEQLVVTNDPVVHVDFIDGNYTVEDLDEKQCFAIRSARSNDYSESQVFGWFTEETVSSVLNKYAPLMSDKDIERVSGWTRDTIGSEFVINNVTYTGNRTHLQESKKNYISFKRLEARDQRYSDYESETVRVMNMYMLIPRKIGRLVTRVDGNLHTQFVDDTFKITERPYYDGEREVENLLYGEHIEWFYKNELWRVIKMDVKNTMYRYDEDPLDQQSVWVMINKCPIQYSEHNMRYGVRIPVHGGPVNEHNAPSMSMVERVAPMQVMFNWVMNRNQQLLSTEVGKFIILNQNMIPQESFDGQWGKNNLLKWFMVAKDASMAPVDPSVTNMGQNANQVSGGFGQVVDLTKTSEVLEKMTLAGAIKEEAYQQAGLTSAFVHGNVSPDMTSALVAQGLQRSLNTIQGYFNRIDQIMARTWETILETAQYVASTAPTVHMTYLTSEAQRVIFNAPTDGFLLHKLGMYVKSSAIDTEALERVRAVAMSNNTLGAGSQEMVDLLSAKSLPELRKQLAELDAKRLMEAEQQRAHEQQLQQKQIEAQERAIQAKLQADTEKDYRDAEVRLTEARIRAVGYGNSDAATIANEVTKLEKVKLDRDKLDLAIDRADKTDRLKRETLDSKAQESDKTRQLQEKVKMRELELKEKEIEARNRRSDAIDDSN